MILLAKLANNQRNNEGIKVCYFTKDLNAKIKVCVQKKPSTFTCRRLNSYLFSSIYKDHQITTAYNFNADNTLFIVLKRLLISL